MDMMKQDDACKKHRRGPEEYPNIPNAATTLEEQPVTATSRVNVEVLAG